MIRKTARSPVLELSGPKWCERFPGGRTTATLAQPFRKSVQRFILALEAAGAQISIAATWRPLQRAYLMRGAWDIYQRDVRPEDMPPLEGVAIQWVHPKADASWEAARAMFECYGLKKRPSLTSRHIDGRAIDMQIAWGGTIEVIDGHGRKVRLSTDQGIDRNPDLHAVGASYGVHKLVSDPPHWSVDGH